MDYRSNKSDINTIKSAQSALKGQSLPTNTERSKAPVEQRIQEILIKADKGAKTPQERPIPSERRHSRKLQATAYHEAGHAVAMWDQGLKFKIASIIPNEAEGTLGHVLGKKYPKGFNPEFDTSIKVRLRAERIILCKFAGQIAEAKFLGRPVRRGMEYDNQTALNLAAYFFGSTETTEAYLNYTFSLARDLVNAQWWAISAVAAALLKRRQMGFDDVVEAIQKALPGGHCRTRYRLEAIARAYAPQIAPECLCGVPARLPAEPDLAGYRNR